MGEAAAKILEALTFLLELLLREYGPLGSVVVIVGLVGVALLVLLYLDWRRNRWVERALAEKDSTIQRLAASDRQWRQYFMIQNGMSREEAERLVVENTFVNPGDARRGLEPGGNP